MDKEGIDVFSQSREPLSPPSFFFCHNNCVAGASSVAMETNVESQLWFCFRGPLGWSTVGTPLTPAFLSAPRTRGG